MAQFYPVWITRHNRVLSEYYYQAEYVLTYNKLTLLDAQNQIDLKNTTLQNYYKQYGEDM
jgi:hypothetical protein